MAVNLKRIEASLREKICPNCVRETRDHRCSLPADEECFIFHHLPQLVEIVRTVHSSSMGPYVDRIREQICATCNEDLHGTCPFRTSLDCAMDTYLPIVIDEIEMELQRQREERGRGGN